MDNKERRIRYLEMQLEAAENQIEELDWGLYITTKTLQNQNDTLNYILNVIEKGGYINERCVCE